MPSNTRTHIYCYDDHRAFSEDVRKKFTDQARYTVLSFPTKEEIISILKADKEHNFCKVAILGLHDSDEQHELIGHLSMEIKKIDPHTGLILLGPPDKMEAIRKHIMFNIDAYIPKNGNAILRIHNTVKKLISEHSMGKFRKRMNVSIYFLIAFLLLTAGAVIFSLLSFPEYF